MLLAPPSQETGIGYLPAVPPRRQGDGQVNLWMDWERRVREQVALPTHTRFLRPGEDSSGLIRHFLIESSAKGVHLRADEEPYFR